MERIPHMVKIAVLTAIAVVSLAACGSNGGKTTSTAAATHHPTVFTSTVFVNAVGMTHQTTNATRPVIGPDDMA